VLTLTCHEKSISAYLPVPELVNIDIKIGQEYIRCVKQNKKIRPWDYTADEDKRSCYQSAATITS
jgi:phage terminase large subunit-like protein